METQKIKGKTRGLGMGIGALIPGATSTALSSRAAAPSKDNDNRSLFQCDVHRIIPNKYQPRQVFDTVALSELSKSIKENGVIQPLIVRRREDGQYELIAGERRLEASKLAGFKKVPVVIKDVTDRQSLEMAIIENIQRDELSCIEEAMAYRQLISDFKMSHEQVALKVGKDRATISNTIRLLVLPREIQENLLEKKISMGHARAILSVSNENKQLELRNRVIKDNLNVRQTEKIAQKIKKGMPEKKTNKKNSADFSLLVDELKKALETKIAVKGRKDKGKIIIHYSNEEELDRIFDVITK
jgi:ParB family chromosome partitioning protein